MTAPDDVRPHGPANVRLTPLTRGQVPTVAALLAAAFETRPESWETLLQRELSGGRLSADHSRLAWLDDTPCGVCLASPGPNGEARIGATGVHPHAQRRGIGRRLVNEAMAALHADGHERLTIEVGADNANALALYGSLGFRKHRSLEILATRRSSLKSPSTTLKAEAMAPEAALDYCTRHRSVAPPFQRRPFILKTFHRGVLAHVVADEGGPRGVLLQSGRDVLDMVVKEPQQRTADALDAIVAALSWAATGHTWTLRMIQVTGDDPLRDALLRVGFEPESLGWELWTGPLKTGSCPD